MCKRRRVRFSYGGFIYKATRGGVRRRRELGTRFEAVVLGSFNPERERILDIDVSGGRTISLLVQSVHTHEQHVREYVEGKETRSRPVPRGKAATRIKRHNGCLCLVRSHSWRHHVPYEQVWKP